MTETQPWVGSSVGQSIIPMCWGCEFDPGQGTYKRQPENAQVRGATNRFLSLKFIYNEEEKKLF